MAPVVDRESGVLFVVGMHRSGTSALCAALAARGVSFGSDLLGPMAGVNDEGFWEDAGVVAIIQPGGSRRDQEVIDACDQHDLPMVMTGRRHFKH